MSDAVWRRSLETTSDTFKSIAMKNRRCRFHMYIGKNGRVEPSLVSGESGEGTGFWTYARDADDRKIEFNGLISPDPRLPKDLSVFDLFREVGNICRTRVGCIDHVGLNVLADDDYWSILLFRLAWKQVPGSSLRAFSEVLNDRGMQPATEDELKHLVVGLRSHLTVDPFTASVAAIDILLSEQRPSVVIHPPTVMHRVTPDMLDVDPNRDPVDAAREYLAGYEFRLSEADRAQHLPGSRALPPDEQHAQFMTMVNRAARGDDNVRAFDVILKQIDNHPSPPYPIEILKIEYKNLEAIPPAQRLIQRYFDRMESWLDRVKAFLAVKTGPTSLPKERATSTETGPTITFGGDYRSCSVGHNEYTFTKPQAACIRALWQLSNQGRNWVAQTSVFELVAREEWAKIKTKRLDQVFRTGKADGRAKFHPAWGTLIRRDLERAGFYQIVVA